jgi:hypothetical protein
VDTGGARRSEGKGQEVRESGHDDNMIIAQLRSSHHYRCHVAVATCKRKSVQAGASAHEWSQPQHDDRAVAIIMLLSSLLQTHINFPRFLPIFPDFLEQLSHLAPIY